MAPLEFFPALQAVPGFAHAFLTRVPGLATDVERGEALERLAPHHAGTLASLGIPPQSLVTAEQIHGAGIAVCSGGEEPRHFAGMDGLATAQPGVWLGIYVADCGAVWLVDPVRRACAVVHSGKKGTELGIVPAGIALMASRFGSAPSDLIVQLSPCIRPPAYEVDFAVEIQRQACRAGVPPEQVHDSGTCTSMDLSRYYSYRTEKGRTGRMLAVAGFRPA